MLDELLTRSDDRYPASPYNWPDIPDLTSRDSLLALHSDVAQWTSNQITSATGTPAAQIIRDLYEIAASAGGLAATEAVQQAVQHVITALRTDAPGRHHEAERELDAARMWGEHARLVAAQGHR